MFYVQKMHDYKTQKTNLKFEKFMYRFQLGHTRKDLYKILLDGVKFNSWLKF